MDKPFTLKMEELKNKIIEEINQAKLPAFNVSYILGEIQKVISEMDKQEIEEYYKSNENDIKEDK